MSTTPRPESEPGSARYTRYARAVSYDANAAMTGTADETIRLADSEQAVLVARVAELEAEVASERTRADVLDVQLDAFTAWHPSSAVGATRLMAAEATLAKARQWIVNCVDPVAVGVDKKREMLAELDAALAPAGRPATSDGEDANGERKAWTQREAQCSDPTCCRPASPVVAFSATDEDRCRHENCLSNKGWPGFHYPATDDGTGEVTP